MRSLHDDRNMISHNSFSKKYIVDDPSQRKFEVSPNLFTDPEIFELEMDVIFSRTWIFLGLESQIPKPHDYFTSRIGRSPILVTKGADGKIRGFLNFCRHKGTALCVQEEGNSKAHVCPYHHWSFDSAGRFVGMKEKAEAHYPESFPLDQLDLIPVKIDFHNGLIFGSLSDEVPTLAEYLGDVRYFIDLLMDQGPNGMEYIPGRAPYTFKANWKLQQDNGLDSYHVTSAHLSLLGIAKQRRASADDGKTVRSRDWAKQQQSQHHYFNFDNGHAVLFAEPTEPEKRPIYRSIKELCSRVGDSRAENMLFGCQIHIFPNLQLASEFASIIRKINPLAVDLTEMEIRCLGAIGEARADRALRLRQFEDFFTASGMATPDDNVIYESCQRGFSGTALPYLQGYARGAALIEEGSNAEARRLGVRPQESLSISAKATPEINLYAPYREWRRRIEAAMDER